MLFSGRNYKMAVVGFLEIISTGYKKKKAVATTTPMH